MQDCPQTVLKEFEVRRCTRMGALGCTDYETVTETRRVCAEPKKPEEAKK